MYIVGFNGPPRSGKDTMARMLAEHLDSKTNLPVREVSLSMPLRRIAYAMVNFIGETDGPDYERFKVTHFPQFDRAGRHLMIDVSESFLKPTYGQQVMADLLIEDLVGFDGIVLIRDMGFQVELDTLAKLIGFHQVYAVRVSREGCDFGNDSRFWVQHPFSANVRNNGTLDDLRTEAVRIYGRMVNQMGWKL